jgi:endonuclease III
MHNPIAAEYQMVKEFVISMGYEKEIRWQETISFDDVDESSFLRELAWVILSSGMREKIVRNIFPEISEIFFFWKNTHLILSYKEKCLSQAIKIFNNKSKISAIIAAAQRINEIGFPDLKKRIENNPLATLRQFPFIGPVTSYHLAKNIGVPIAKPDRHLVRIANLNGFANVQDFCMRISDISGDCISVVDIIFWRFAASCPDYLIRLSPYQESVDMDCNSRLMGCIL